MEELKAKKAGQTLHRSYPAIEDGIESMKFVECCIASSARNGAWVSW